MTETTTATIDPMCGMTVNPASAVHADRDGKTFYFCGERCRRQFLALLGGTKPTAKPGSCCG